MENMAERIKESEDFNIVESLDENNCNRLALGVIEQTGCKYTEALETLNSMTLSLYCGEAIKFSSSLQAALLTAINCGKRAFLGGVYVSMPKDVLSLIRWPDKPILNDIVKELGGKDISSSQGTFALYFGIPAVDEGKSLQIIADGWRAGVLVPGDSFEAESEDFVLSGIAAASLGVAIAIIKSTKIRLDAADHSIGISLWQPKVDWRSPSAIGPIVESLPSKVWILGLGHLGQAYIWSLGLLPYNNYDDTLILLQDFDTVVKANIGSGLLCDEDSLGSYKTRVCAEWLEKRGFKTKITERPFDQNTKVNINTEPRVALCGFDKAEPRRFLEEANFDYIVECALGGDLSDFDKMFMHTFPNSSKLAKDIWNFKDGEVSQKEEVLNALRSEGGDKCGYIQISNKAISSSFVGAFASTLVLSELIKGLTDGFRNEKIVLSLRNLANRTVIPHGQYTQEMLRNGFVKVKSN